LALQIDPGWSGGAAWAGMKAQIQSIHWRLAAVRMVRFSVRSVPWGNTMPRAVAVLSNAASAMCIHWSAIVWVVELVCSRAVTRGAFHWSGLGCGKPWQDRTEWGICSGRRMTCPTTATNVVAREQYFFFVQANQVRSMRLRFK
jgi:hypothetical protein